MGTILVHVNGVWGCFGRAWSQRKGDGNLMLQYNACCAFDQASNKLPENWFSTQEALAPSWHD